METGGTLVIGTGKKDLRGGIKDNVQTRARSGVVFEQDVAAGARFADRTNFTHDFTLTILTDLTDPSHRGAVRAGSPRFHERRPVVVRTTHRDRHGRDIDAYAIRP